MGCDDENPRDVRDAVEEDEGEEEDMLEGEDVRGRMLKKEGVEMIIILL